MFFFLQYFARNNWKRWADTISTYVLCVCARWSGWNRYYYSVCGVYYVSVITGSKWVTRKWQGNKIFKRNVCEAKIKYGHFRAEIFGKFKIPANAIEVSRIYESLPEAIFLISTPQFVPSYTNIPYDCRAAHVQCGPFPSPTSELNILSSSTTKCPIRMLDPVRNVLFCCRCCCCCCFVFFCSYAQLNFSERCSASVHFTTFAWPSERPMPGPLSWIVRCAIACINEIKC